MKKDKRAITVVKLTSMGIISYDAFLVELRPDAVFFTVGRERKAKGLRLAQVVIADGHGKLQTFPKPYTEKREGNFVIQESRHCMFSDKWMEEWNDWIKTVNPSETILIA